MIEMRMTRLDHDVQAVIATAHELAEGGSRTVIGEEHLLVAVLETQAGAQWLSPLTAAQTRTKILPAVGRARAMGGLSASDRAALERLGVHLPSLERRVESLDMGEFMSQPARPTGGWGQRVTDTAAVVLGRAEDLAVSRRRRAIGLSELVAALVEVPSLVVEHLAAHGVTAASVRLHQQEGSES